jgi:hypothetical protein
MLLRRLTSIIETFLRGSCAHRPAENLPKHMYHSTNLVSKSVIGQGKVTPPKCLPKLALHVLCHPLLDLELLQSRKNGYQVIPATRNRRLRLVQLLEPRLGAMDKDCDDFAVINPGAYLPHVDDVLMVVACDACTSLARFFIFFFFFFLHFMPVPNFFLHPFSCYADRMDLY